MKLNRKLEIIDQAIRSVSDHADEDAAVRLAAMDRVVQIVEAAKQRIEAEVKAGIEAALKAT